ncbi:RAP protein, putative [Plasmodium gallinaceum]|uniref:RAP protein, putative n=1 Tax=Plasmodium gallinaceum TaxID=5849 RepID=A0A1J1H013_PLAGA|nr:RAP protein, putative [Plasmodium gallinaceum]CRG98044.1 RAP protein, putative [Plasmodium gallinaceum]
MIFFFNILLLTINFIYIIGILILHVNDVHSIGIKSVCKQNYKISDFIYISKRFQNKNKLPFHQNAINCSFSKKRNSFYYHIKNRNYNSRTLFLETFNKRNYFIKPLFIKFGENKIQLKKKGTHILFIKNSDDTDLQKNSDNHEIDFKEDENFEYKENESHYLKELNSNQTSKDINNNNDCLDKSKEYDLVNEYILLKKNSKSIRELIDEEKWLCPKENLNIIRKRTNKIINWNYILKKNNELLNDNVDKIYNGIYKKDNIDDILFVFDTYPYNYLNITMSVFSLYKFASSYLYEKKLKSSMIYEKKNDFFKNIKNENLSNDNFLSLGNEDADDDDDSLLKVKEERKRLNYIIKNRNFQRVVGSINKHLKIIYKIFTGNEKLTSYDKSKKIYEFIPYINIKDIITILKSFYILKYDHTNIFKYIYFYIVYFIDKFDIYNLCEAVYLCLIKKIYIKSLFLNFSKYLLKYFQKNNETFIHEENNIKQNYQKDIPVTNECDNKEKNMDNNMGEEHIYNYSNEENKSNNNDKINMNNNNNEYNNNSNNEGKVNTQSEYNSELFKNNGIDFHCKSNNDTVKRRNKDNLTIDKGVPNKIKINESVISLYEEININDIYNNMEKILKKKNNESNNNLLPYHLKNFDYSIYHTANYSNLNNSLDDLKQINKNEEMQKFSAEDKTKDKIDFIENKIIKENLHNKKDEYSRINFYVYVLYILSKFPYTNLKILNIIVSEIMKNINDLSLEELILSFYSIAELEYDSFKLQNNLYILIFKNLHLLNYSNKSLILKLIKSLYLTNNLCPIMNENTINKELDNEQKIERNMNMQENENFLRYSKNSNIENIKILMIYFISKMILKNINNYTPIELVDIIRYMSALNFVNKELFNFVYNLPFFKNLNEDVLNIYRNNIYFNNSYYAYTKDNTINTPIEIMLCKLYQSYLSYNMYINNSLEDNLDVEIMKKIYKKNNEHKSFRFDIKIVQLLKDIYLNNMKISSYNSSSLHYEIADIIQKDFNIPCHVEYKTSNGILIDIAILYEDFKKINKNFPFFKNIAIEINGPFHYKTKSLNNNLPLLNTKTIFKKRLLENDNWQVISFPFWEIKPWFSKIRKENYILKMLPDKLKSFFNN